MIIEDILSEIRSRKHPLSPETFPKYQDIVANAGKYSPFTIYPDSSRSIDDIVSVMGMITSEGSPLLSIVNSFLLHRQAGGVQVYFEDGLRTPPHTHNYTELGYVAEGQFHAHIGDQDYLFNKGDIFLINKNISHNECLYRRNSAILFLSIANTFFDKSMHHEVYDSETENFIRHFIIKGAKYHFIRFISKENKCRISGLFENILSEILRPHPGTMHLIIGYVEWILNLLPAEYEIIVERNNRNAAGDALFKEIRRVLEDRYQDITLNDLIEQFGHNMNYYNRLIKAHTGMTFSAFAQNIKLEKAEFLLKTTDLPVEEVARQTGYENLSYFYKIFREKFNLTPNNLRNQKFSTDRIQNPQ